MAEQKKFIRVELDFPVEKKDSEGNEITISSVNVYRLKVKHLKQIPDSVFASADTDGNTNLSIKDMISILSACSSLKDDEMDSVDVNDLKKMIQAMADENFL